MKFQIKLSMKKHILFFGFLLMVFGLRIDAQTLKNIHRHNQPVLRIPTHLIDKVETAEVNGVQVLQVRQLNGFVSEIPLAQIDSITHSEGEAVDPAQYGNLLTASVMGVVTGPTGAPVNNAIVRSPYGGEETRTDMNGVFFLNNILVYDKLGYITITKPGFHQGSRSFLPLENGSNRVNVQLLPMTLSGSFDATSGGTITAGSLQLNFPSFAVAINGFPYFGTVNVYTQTLDPSSTNMFDQMPGELLGGLDDSLRLLRAFGLASIELRDGNMNELQLAPGVTSTLTLDIPASLQADAPQTISKWSFDESQGIWMQEGSLQRQGNSYVDEVSHFSWWAFCLQENFNDFNATISSSGGSPISNARVNLESPTLGSGILYTNAEGEMSGRVPQNQTLDLSAFITCNTISDWTLIYTQNVQSAEAPVVGSYVATLNGYFPVSGNLLNCENQLVNNGYVLIGSQIHPTNQGSFNIQVCSLGEYEVQGFDVSISNSILTSDLDTFLVDADGVNVGSLQCCVALSNVVMDFDGNVYSTVEIGSQVWLTENLKTTHFADGSEIFTFPFDAQVFGPAWWNYQSNPANDAIYGKLYSWYTTSDPRNVCPTGWHVPSRFEWELLILHVDPTFITSNGATELGGGKLKSTSNWDEPNVNATNETGFSALPGGLRGDFDIDTYFYLGTKGHFWTSSAIDQYFCDYLYLSNDSEAIYFNSSNAAQGMSIRCVQD
jgi:uncharacterized protein (TIGR02145 family)